MIYQINYTNGTLTSAVCGSFDDGLPLANVTIAGIKTGPSSVGLKLAGQQCDTSAVQMNYSNNVLLLTDLDGATSGGVWSGELKIMLS